MSIADKGLLVNITLSVWSGRKLDKQVSEEVDVAKSTRARAGNYNKNLLAGTGFLDTILKYASNARAWHISQTLPWSDNGLRLLPVTNFVAYKEQLNTLETNYNALVEKFLIAYPNLVSAAAFQLGTLFNREEYPEADKIATKFKFGVNFLPVPTVNDFRVDIGEEAKQEILLSCQTVYEDRLNSAMKDAWGRLHEHLLRMSDRLADLDTPRELKNGEKVYTKVFRDSLLENAVELVDLLKHFNLTNDPSMEQARKDLDDAIMYHDVEDLRDNHESRMLVKSKVDDILSKFNF
jgi:hypothetical protein